MRPVDDDVESLTDLLPSSIAADSDDDQSFDEIKRKGSGSTSIRGSLLTIGTDTGTGTSITSIAIGSTQLPELLLVEILCRLPCKYVVQCKCVSKAWCTLISDPYFVGRFVCVVYDNNHDQPNIIFSMLIEYSFFHRQCELTRTLSLSFMLPPLEGKKYYEGLVVRGVHNDLVLLSSTSFYERDYYISNPYTKQYVALPLPRRGYENTHVAFICDPYYTYSTSTSAQVNADYRWSVVKCSIPDLSMDIFSSHKGEWRELELSLSPGDIDKFGGTKGDIKSPGRVCNGMLYWWGTNFNKPISCFTYELDPLSGCGRIFESPQLNDFDKTCFVYLFEWQGCLRACKLMQLESGNEMGIWELKKLEDHVGSSKKKWWCLIYRVADYHHMFLTCQDQRIARYADKLHDVLGFDPNNEDIVYISVEPIGVVKCKLGTRKLEFFMHYPDDYDGQSYCDRYFTFVLPLWPTPVPKLLSPILTDDYHGHAIGQSVEDGDRMHSRRLASQGLEEQDCRTLILQYKGLGLGRPQQYVYL